MNQELAKERQERLIDLLDKFNKILPEDLISNLKNQVCIDKKQEKIINFLDAVCNIELS